MDPVELSDDRLLLRLPVEADVDDITRACQDPVLQRWIPVPVPYERIHAEQWVADTERSWAEDRELRWVIVERTAVAGTAVGGTAVGGTAVGATAVGATAGGAAGRPPGPPVGAIGLHARDATMREVGFWMAPSARGRGIMTDAVRLVCRWGFAELGLGRIEWWANVGNEASRRVAVNAGFTMEGTVRARLLHRGERVDGWGAGLLPGDLMGEQPEKPSRERS
jgi:RimJ/RimL family protein N-acetyltransferase